MDLAEQHQHCHHNSGLAVGKSIEHTKAVGIVAVEPSCSGAA